MNKSVEEVQNGLVTAEEKSFDRIMSMIETTLREIRQLSSDVEQLADESNQIIASIQGIKQN